MYLDKREGSKNEKDKNLHRLRYRISVICVCILIKRLKKGKNNKTNDFILIFVLFIHNKLYEIM